MGRVEDTAKKRAKKENLQALILDSLVLVGGILMAATAPNAIQSFAKLGLIDNRNKNLSRSLKSLLKKDFVCFEQGRSGKKHLSITEKGRRKILLWKLDNYKIYRPARWDGKWRIIIFGIKEKRRYVRDQLRLYMRKAGLERLQNSVWVYPYDCEEVFILLKADLELGRNLLYIVADVIEDDRKLRRYFGLSIE